VATANQDEPTSSTPWGWVAFGILAAAVIVGGIVWWLRRRHSTTGGGDNTPHVSNEPSN